MEEDSISFTRRIINQKRANTTKIQYESGINILRDWLLDTHPNFVGN